MKNEKDKILKETVIEKIKKGDVEMRSKSYFILKGFLVFGTIGLSFVFAIYLLTLLIFVLRINDIILLSDFGWYGLSIFIKIFPWAILFLSLFFLLLTDILSRKFSFAYRKTIIVSLGVVTLIVFFFSILIDSYSLQDKVYQSALRNEIPIGRQMYRDLANIESENVVMGKVVEINEEFLIIEKDNQEKVTVIITDPASRHFRSLDRVREGESVFVIGEEDDTGKINAFGVKKMVRGRDR